MCYCDTQYNIGSYMLIEMCSCDVYEYCFYGNALNVYTLYPGIFWQVGKDFQSDPQKHNMKKRNLRLQRSLNVLQHSE